MPDIDIKRAHDLGLAAARAAADRMADDLRRKFGLSGDWRGNTLHFERPGITGKLEVAEAAVHITATLGFLMKAMKPSIEKAVMGELDRLVAPRPATGAKKLATKPSAKPVTPKTGSKPRR